MTAHAFSLLLAFTWLPAVALAYWHGRRVGRATALHKHARRVRDAGADWRAT